MGEPSRAWKGKEGARGRHHWYRLRFGEIREVWSLELFTRRCLYLAAYPERLYTLTNVLRFLLPCLRCRLYTSEAPLILLLSFFSSLLVQDGRFVFWISHLLPFVPKQQTDSTLYGWKISPHLPPVFLQRRKDRQPAENPVERVRPRSPDP